MGKRVMRTVLMMMVMMILMAKVVLLLMVMMILVLVVEIMVNFNESLNRKIKTIKILIILVLTGGLITQM